MSIETQGSIVVARVDDNQIGADSADEFKSRILAQLSTERGKIAVNLSKVDFVDSSGLGALVSLLKAVRPGGDLVLYGVRSSVREILRLTHLDAVFNCKADEETALSSLDPS
jgi:anti-sigma B factor antagonist